MLRGQTALCHSFRTGWQALLSSDRAPLRASFAHLKEEASGTDITQGELSAYTSFLHRRGSSRSRSQAKLLHSHIIEDGHDKYQALQSAILHMYAQCGALDEAGGLFSQLHCRHASSWACIIAAHARLVQPLPTLQLFRQMCIEGTIPVKPTFISVLSSFSDSVFIAEIKRMHTRIKNSTMHSDVVIATVLVSAYSNCRCFKDANLVFGGILERDAVLWVVVIRAHLQAGQCEEAFELFQQMMMEGILPNEFVYASVLAACDSKLRLRKGQMIHAQVAWSDYRSDSVVCNALITMYGKCGELEDATAAFGDSDDQDKVTWNAMIGACAQHNQGKDALCYVQQMQQRGFVPDDLTFMSAFDACANQPAMTEGKQLHTHLVSLGLEVDVNVGNALLNMYGRCGSVVKARSVFYCMPQRNVITWTTMIAAYAQHGLVEDALDVASKMVQAGITPNSITFVNILTACGHAGLVKEGCKYFASMRHSHITPTIEHYNCLLDLLGRAGLLDQGETLLKHLPIESTLALWTTLLGGCRIHFDVERGDYAASQALNFKSQEPGPYILLRNMLSASRQDDPDMIV
eukprot:c2482_g1_i1 orf=297-2024(-)